MFIDNRISARTRASEEKSGDAMCPCQNIKKFEIKIANILHTLPYPAWSIDKNRYQSSDFYRSEGEVCFENEGECGEK